MTGGDEMSAVNEHCGKKPRDVLFFRGVLRDIDAGSWILLSLGESCHLSRVGRNEAGRMCATSRRVHVSLEELSLFEPTGLTVSDIDGDA